MHTTKLNFGKTHNHFMASLHVDFRDAEMLEQRQKLTSQYLALGLLPAMHANEEMFFGSKFTAYV